MFFPESNVNIWLYCQATDMRKSFHGLLALVLTQLARDPLSGDMFVFINRRKTHMKILYFDGSGYCIWMKRLEQGQFNYRPHSSEKYRQLDWTQLRLLLVGMEVKTYRQYKRYQHPCTQETRYNTQHDRGIESSRKTPIIAS